MTKDEKLEWLKEIIEVWEVEDHTIEEAMKIVDKIDAWVEA